MYRDPVRGKWRLSTERDRHRRGFDMMAEPPVVVPKKRKSRSRRR